MTGGGGRVVGADDEDRLVGPFGEEAPAGEGGVLRVGVGERPVGVRQLAGMVGHVAGDHRPLGLGLDHHADVAWRMAGGRGEPDLGRDHVVHLHQLDEPSSEDRLDAVAEHRLLFLVLIGAPEVVLAPAEEVAGLRERRHPFAALEHRVPPDVVDVQVRTHHGVDSVARPACFAKKLQERCRQRFAARDLARPVVPDAGVDDQLEPRRVDQQRVDAEIQDVVVPAHEMRIEPRATCAAPRAWPAV